jgi:hypothetical protein
MFKMGIILHKVNVSIYKISSPPTKNGGKQNKHKNGLIVE